MSARWPQDPKRSGAIGVVVEHSDEQTFTKLPAYGEVGQVGEREFAARPSSSLTWQRPGWPSFSGMIVGCIAERRRGSRLIDGTGPVFESTYVEDAVVAHIFEHFSG